MLHHLHIRHFTIIDDLALDLADGMTVLTGETGAGKSIVIDAIEFALGQRITTAVVRPGSERAEITLSFDVSCIPLAKAWLIEQGLDNGEECLVRRLVSQDGRSKSFINDTPVTLARMKELASLLINIHGQHEFQTLVRPAEQRQLLDQYGDTEILNAKLNEIFKNWQEKQAEYEALLASNHEAKSRADYLSFQLQELTELNLTVAELKQLEQEHKRLSHSESLLASCRGALDLLNEQENSVLNQLAQVAQQLEPMQNYAEQLKEIIALINNATIQAEEAGSELQHFLSQIELSPERLQEVDQRLSCAYDLARKHRVEVAELPELTKQMSEEFERLTHYDETLARLEARLAELVKNYDAQAKKLSKQRAKTAKQLSQQITANMQTLGMPGGVFSIELEAKEAEQLHLNGRERVNFLVSANPGQKLQPLGKVASGGELSRISLAVQVITTQQSNTPTLVFDEIDVGIGGATADIVGTLLRKLAGQAQVFCITHLAQVAAKGHQHLQVQKSVQKGQTLSTLIQLDKKARVAELARMTGGSKITEQTLAHAEEMLGLE